MEGKGRTVCGSLGQSSVSLIFSRSSPSCVGSGQGQKKRVSVSVSKALWLVTNQSSPSKVANGYAYATVSVRFVALLDYNNNRPFFNRYLLISWLSIVATYLRTVPVASTYSLNHWSSLIRLPPIHPHLILFPLHLHHACHCFHLSKNMKMNPKLHLHWLCGVDWFLGSSSTRKNIFWKQDDAQAKLENKPPNLRRLFLSLCWPPPSHWTYLKPCMKFLL